MTKYTVIASVSALALLSTAALAQERRTYADPYPYLKSSEVKSGPLGQFYELAGCGDYEIVPPSTVKQVCDRRSTGQIFKTTDKEAAGTGAQ